jgi:hypothetical protein
VTNFKTDRPCGLQHPFPGKTHLGGFEYENFSD